MMTKLRKRLRTEIRKLMLFPVSPQVFHRIERRRIGGQILKVDPAVLLDDKVLDEPAAVRSQSVPNRQHVRGNVTHQMRETLNDLRASDAARIQPKVKIPPRHSSHGQSVFQLKEYCSTGFVLFFVKNPRLLVGDGNLGLWAAMRKSILRPSNSFAGITRCSTRSTR